MKKSLKLLAAVMALLLTVSLFPAVGNAAETIEVTELTGAAIQQAIDGAEPGDTIVLSEGTYLADAMITISKSLTIKGAGIDRTRIDFTAMTDDCVGILMVGIVGPAAVTLEDFTVQNVGEVYPEKDGAVYVSKNVSQDAIFTFNRIKVTTFGRAGLKILGGTSYINDCVVDCTVIWHSVCNGIEIDGEYARDDVYGEYPTTVHIDGAEIFGANDIDSGWTSGGVALWGNTVCTMTNSKLYDNDIAFGAESYYAYPGSGLAEPSYNRADIEANNTFTDNLRDINLTTYNAPDGLWLVANNATNLDSGSVPLDDELILYTDAVPAERRVADMEALLATIGTDGGFDPATDFAFSYAEGSDAEEGDAVAVVASEDGYNALKAASPMISSVSVVDPETGAVAPMVDEMSTEVIANSSPSYIIVIPTLVDFGTINRAGAVQTRDFNISIEEALIDAGATVDVVVQSDFTMECATGSAVLPYVLTGNATAPYISFGYAGTGDTAIVNYTATHTDTVTCNPGLLTRAGSYSDTMVFVCSYNS